MKRLLFLIAAFFAGAVNQAHYHAKMKAKNEEERAS